MGLLVCAARGRYNPLPGGVSERDCQRCDASQDSVDGSAECTVCAKGYYKPHAFSPSSECGSCSAIRGVTCGFNTTVETLILDVRYWRHSPATIQMSPCKTSGGWSPCRGGSDLSTDGDGYCVIGYHGPRCELCSENASSMYFDKLDARCHSCGDVNAKVLIVLGILVSLLLVAAVGRAVLHRSPNLRACRLLLKKIRSARKLWRRAGMRYKVKLLVGLAQCVAAVPTVFDVSIPEGLEAYTDWINVLELSAHIGIDLVVPTPCLGSYHR